MQERESKPAPSSSAKIVGLVVSSKARGIVREFKDGASIRTLSIDYSLSRKGVEDLVRAYGWLRNGRKPAAAR